MATEKKTKPKNNPPPEKPAPETPPSAPTSPPEDAPNLDTLTDQLPDMEYPDAPGIDEEALFSWVAPERVFRPRISRTYTRNLVLLFALIVLLLVFLNQMALLIVVLALIFFFYVLNNVPPLKTRHTITNYGIYTHDRFYPWTQRGNNFWWEESHGQRYVVVETKIFPYKLVMLEGTERNQPLIDEVLGLFLTPHKPKQTSGEKMLDRLKQMLALD